jgi:hypothetical protein
VFASERYACMGTPLAETAKQTPGVRNMYLECMVVVYEGWKDILGLRPFRSDIETFLEMEVRRDPATNRWAMT